MYSTAHTQKQKVWPLLPRSIRSDQQQREWGPPDGELQGWVSGRFGTEGGGALKGHAAAAGDTGTLEKGQQGQGTEVGGHKVCSGAPRKPGLTQGIVVCKGLVTKSERSIRISVQT